MIMSEPSRAAVERSFTGQNDPALIGVVQDTVRRICQAEAVVFDIFNEIVISPFAGGADEDADALAQELVTFLGQDDAPAAPETGLHHDLNGREFMFVRLPLIARGEVIGKSALAVPRTTWEEKNGLVKCIDVSRMVSMLVMDNRSKVDLEVDLIDMRRRVERMTRKAEIDPLTRVDNKASFEKKAQARLQSGARASALLVLDVDHFKTVNDIFGHQFDDDYLRSIAEALQSTLPRGALIGRIGGDEFCALVDLPSTARMFLDSLIKQLRAFLRRSAAVMGKPELGRVSIGVGIFPMQAPDYQSLFSAADAALYASKRTGRNTTTIYNSELKMFLNHRDFADYFLRALKRGEIIAHFQPIVALKSGARTGFEVLARWQDPAKGLITPQSFEPVFHDHRMAAALTSQIIKDALEQVSRLPGFTSRGGPELWFNLTTFDLLNPEFVFEMQTALARVGLGWERIIVEVTERVMLGDRHGQVYRSLDEVRRRGGRVAFDDFGTGHAGLLHIKDWPVDIIKIDRSFTGGIGKCERDQIVVKALLQIASTMKQDVVAEGIETELQLSTLQRLGCRYGQGYLFSKALAAEDLAGSPSRYELCDAIPA